MQQQDDNPAETQTAISIIPRRRTIFISGLEVLNEFSVPKRYISSGGFSSYFMLLWFPLALKHPRKIKKSEVQELLNETAAFRSVDCDYRLATKIHGQGEAPLRQGRRPNPASGRSLALLNS